MADVPQPHKGRTKIFTRIHAPRDGGSYQAFALRVVIHYAHFGGDRELSQLVSKVTAAYPRLMELANGLVKRTIRSKVKKP